ncbi:hypothetical protein MASR2M17_08770 [Aminivibrio sp.]
MLQFSVYSRIVYGEDSVDKHLKRLADNIPGKGSIRFLQITERQYAAMKLVGQKTVKEKMVEQPAFDILRFFSTAKRA